MTDDTTNETPNNVKPIHTVGRNLHDVSSSPAEVVGTTNGAIMKMLPSSIRKAIIGQYAESAALKHTPDEFIVELEDRLLKNAAADAFSFFKNLINTKPLN